MSISLAVANEERWRQGRHRASKMAMPPPQVTGGSVDEPDVRDEAARAIRLSNRSLARGFRASYLAEIERAGVGLSERVIHEVASNRLDGCPACGLSHLAIRLTADGACST